MEQRIPTTEKLAKALEEAGAPETMIRLAQEGRYDKWKSDTAYPKMALVQEAQLAKLPPEFIQRIVDDEFDAEYWEAEEWAIKEGILPKTEV